MGPTTRDEGMMEEHSYYSSMVAAAIVATFALMGLAIILYFYLRRHTTYKATITKTALPATQAQPMITLPSKTLTEVLHHRQTRGKLLNLAISLAWTLKIMESPTSTTLEGSQLW